MRSRALAALAVLALVGCASRPPARAPASRPAVLELRFVEMRSDRGALVYAVYGDERSFDAGDEPRAAGALAIRGGVAERTVELPPGRYAVKAYHDVNANGTLDRGAFGRPSEPYGFSNDARGAFGAPSWRSASFSLDAPRQRIEVRLR